MAALVAGILVLMTLLEPAEAAFPGANGRIAFTSNRTGNFEIYRMSVADTNHDGQGDNPRNLTDISGQNSDPVYSPNGAKIAFQSNRDTNAEIYVMNATTGERQVNFTQNVATDFEASWQALP